MRFLRIIRTRHLENCRFSSLSVFNVMRYYENQISDDNKVGIHKTSMGIKTEEIFYGIREMIERSIVHLTMLRSMA